MFRPRLFDERAFSIGPSSITSSLSDPFLTAVWTVSAAHVLVEMSAHAGVEMVCEARIPPGKCRGAAVFGPEAVRHFFSAKAGKNLGEENFLSLYFFPSLSFTGWMVRSSGCHMSPPSSSPYPLSLSLFPPTVPFVVVSSSSSFLGSAPDKNSPFLTDVLFQGVRYGTKRKFYPYKC